MVNLECEVKYNLYCWKCKAKGKELFYTDNKTLLCLKCKEKGLKLCHLCEKSKPYKELATFKDGEGEIKFVVLPITCLKCHAKTKPGVFNTIK